MKKDIILAGVGGQGILSIASVIDYAALSLGYKVKQAEVHGMSQRGGDVQSHLRISDGEIYSDLIGLKGADIIISVEPMESLRYIPYLKADGWVVTSKNTFRNIPNYPDDEVVYAEIEKLPKHIMADADALAKEAGTVKASNMVMLGVASSFIDIPYNALQDAVKAIFAEKGDKVIDINLKALEAGRQCSINR